MHYVYQVLMEASSFIPADVYVLYKVNILDNDKVVIRTYDCDDEAYFQCNMLNMNLKNELRQS